MDRAILRADIGFYEGMILAGTGLKTNVNTYSIGSNLWYNPSYKAVPNQAQQNANILLGAGWRIVSLKGA